MPLMTDFASVVSVVLGVSATSSVLFVVRCVNPKYHRIKPISSTPPAVPSISGKRSMSG